MYDRLNTFNDKKTIKYLTKVLKNGGHLRGPRVKVGEGYETWGLYNRKGILNNTLIDYVIVKHLFDEDLICKFNNGLEQIIENVVSYIWKETSKQYIAEHELRELIGK